MYTSFASTLVPWVWDRFKMLQKRYTCLIGPIMSIANFLPNAGITKKKIYCSEGTCQIKNQGTDPIYGFEISWSTLFQINWRAGLLGMEVKKIFRGCKIGFFHKWVKLKIWKNGYLGGVSNNIRWRVWVCLGFDVKSSRLLLKQI